MNVKNGKCEECNYIAEYNFSEYGATEPCVECDAAPVMIVMVA